MVSEGQEILIGVSRDPVFGPVLTVGLGGIYVEVLKDVVFRLPPVGKSEILEMLQELRSYPYWPVREAARPSTSRRWRIA